MPAPIRKDSMSRCEAPSMLYDTVRNPAAPHVPLKPAVDVAKDTLESTQQRLNREMLERFQNTSSRLPHQSFVVVVQAGKYLFLAIMLPPYICFYGIPRWFLMDALPKFFIMAKTECLRVGRFFNKVSTHVVDMMKGILEQMIGDSLRALNQRGKNLLSYFSKASKRIAISIRDSSKIIRSGMRIIHEAILEAAHQISRKAKGSLKQAVLFKDKAIKAAKYVSQAIFYPLDVADKFLIKPAIARASKKVFIASWTVQGVVLRSANAFAARLKKAAKPVIDIGKSLSNYVSDVTRQAALFAFRQLSDWFKPKIAFMERARDKAWRGIARAGSAIREKTKELASAATENITQQVQIPIQVFVQFTGYAWWLMAPPFRRQWERLSKAAGHGKRFFKGFGAFAHACARGMASQGSWLVIQIIIGAGKLAKMFKFVIKWLFAQLTSLPRKALRLLIWLLKSFVRALRFTIYSIRLVVAWVWVVSGCGRLLLQELTKEIGSWATFKKS